MIRFLTLVVLALALVSTQAESRSKRIHVTAQVVKQTFTGDLANPAVGRHTRHQCRAVRQER